MNGDCKYLVDNSTSTVKRGKCIITNDICGYIRFCRDKNKIVSSPLYKINGCRIQIEHESEEYNNG